MLLNCCDFFSLPLIQCLLEVNFQILGGFLVALLCCCNLIPLLREPIWYDFSLLKFIETCFMGQNIVSLGEFLSAFKKYVKYLFCYGEVFHKYQLSQSD